MAEVATSVLHNVGNVLNSVNVSATLVMDLTRQSKSAYVGKVAALLSTHAGDLGAFLTDDPRGKPIPLFLADLAGKLVAEQIAIAEELGVLRKNIEHIKDIVASQQSVTRISGVTDAVSMVELVEDTLRMGRDGLDAHRIEVIRDIRRGQ